MLCSLDAGFADSSVARSRAGRGRRGAAPGQGRARRAAPTRRPASRGCAASRPDRRAAQCFGDRPGPATELAVLDETHDAAASRSSTRPSSLGNCKAAQTRCGRARLRTMSGGVLAATPDVGPSIGLHRHAARSPHARKLAEGRRPARRRAVKPEENHRRDRSRRRRQAGHRAHRVPVRRNGSPGPHAEGNEQCFEIWSRRRPAAGIACGPMSSAAIAYR